MDEDVDANGQPVTLSAERATAPTVTADSTDDKPEWWTSDHWATPLRVFNAISRQYGPFDLDACATDQTAKCMQWFTREDDGLHQPWYGRVWVNPPYSDPRPWIQKAVDSIRYGQAQRVVMLLPASTDTAWFHDLVLPHADVVFIRGRIKFLGWRGTPIGSPKAGNIIAVFPKASAAFSFVPAVDPHVEDRERGPRAHRSLYV